MNGSMGRFRIPGMMEDINIEEIISRSKRAPVKPKPKPKAKVVKTPKQAVSKKIKKPPLTKYQKEKLKKFDEKFKGKKIKPRPKPKMPIRPNMRGGRLGLMEDIGLPPVAKKKAVAVKPKPQFKPKVTPRPSPVKVPTRPKISIEELMKVGSETKGRPNIPNVGMSGVIPGVNINIEEIIKQATPTPAPAQQPETGSQEGPSVDGPSREEILKSIARIIGGSESSGPIKRKIPHGIFKDAIYPGDSGYEEALAESKLSDSGGGGLFGGGRRLTPEIIQMIKEAQEARRATGGGGLFGLIGGGQRPQAPEIPQWNMMGPQQPINPIVAAGPQQPSQFMPRPQIPSEMFGGYGGTAPIVPAMAYAGLGGLPQMPIMPAPQYDPDAEPGGPPMPTGPVFT